MENILKKFDLTDNEIRIYKTLLELGSGLAGEITGRTGIHRRNVYDSIERLVKKGLVGYITKNNRKYYQGTTPKHFFYLIEKEQEALRQRERDLKKILPQLLLTQRLSKETQRVTVFEGKKGLITILEDVLKTGKPNLVFSTTKIRFVREYLKWFHTKRVGKKIVDRLILNERETNRANYLAKMPYTEVRLMKKEFDSPVALNIYSNKVGMLIFSGNPIAILIEDKNVADSFRNYFELLWEMAQEV